MAHDIYDNLTIESTERRHFLVGLAIKYFVQNLPRVAHLFAE